ncbi:SLC13 family permease [Mailhella massiliensis]|uniref:Anion permease n=1 Tax=Mailhella massiliensis TaxID=1903261 RepID=A0A921DQ78_9BACT|nr:SLC13 family permease [Mailhella massiliensis]HJD96185.1 anion permease [Mailhella massiliensis]
MPSASVLSLKNSKLLSWLICFAIAGAATFLLYDAAKPQVNLYWFGTILAIAMFATSLLPNFATVVLLLMYYVITGVAAPELAFVGWTAPIPWLSLCGMLLGVLMDKCNLASRIALVLLTRIGTTPVRLYAAFLLAGLVLAAIIPDIITVMIIFMTIAQGMCTSLKLDKNSRSSATIILAAFFGAAIPSAMYLPNNTGIIGLLMVKDMGVPFTWLSFAFENMGFQALHAFVAYGILHVFGSRELAVHIASCRAVASDELRKLGSMSREEKKTLLLTVAALIGFVSEPLHHIPGYYVFCSIVLLGFTPLFKLLTGDDIEKVQFSILFFIAGCMAIGIIAGSLGIPAWLSEKLMPILREIQSLPLASFFAYWVGVLSNLVLTPVAAATSLSIPMAEIATSLGMPIKPVLYSFLYGLDQFFLPYELAPALIMFATGYVRIRYVLVLMTLRMFLVSFAVLITATFLWPMMGM